MCSLKKYMCWADIGILQSIFEYVWWLKDRWQPNPPGSFPLFLIPHSFNFTYFGGFTQIKCPLFLLFLFVWFIGSLFLSSRPILASLFLSSLHSEPGWWTWASCETAIKQAPARPPGVLLTLHSRNSFMDMHTQTHNHSTSRMGTSICAPIRKP